MKTASCALFVVFGIACSFDPAAQQEALSSGLLTDPGFEIGTSGFSQRTNNTVARRTSGTAYTAIDGQASLQVAFTANKASQSRWTNTTINAHMKQFQVTASMRIDKLGGAVQLCALAYYSPSGSGPITCTQAANQLGVASALTATLALDPTKITHSVEIDISYGGGAAATVSVDDVYAFLSDGNSVDMSAPPDLAAARDLAQPPARDMTQPMPSDMAQPAVSCGTPPSATAMPTGTLVYVDRAATGTANGTLANPYFTIEAGVNAAGNDAKLLVAAGTYVENVTLPESKNLTLMGGFASGFSSRDSAVHVTTVQAPTTASATITSNVSAFGGTVSLDGLRVVGGAPGFNRDSWMSGSVNITRCLFEQNTCGVNLHNAGNVISGNLFQDNSCGNGGAVAVTDANPYTLTSDIENNCFQRNHGTAPTASHAGALYAGTKFETISHNTFLDNTSTAWGSAASVFGTATLSYNTYSQNHILLPDGRGALFIDDGSRATVDHETITNNFGGGIYFDDSESRATITNSTIADNLTPDGLSPSFAIIVTINAGNAPVTGTLINIDNTYFHGQAPDFTMSTSAIPLINVTNSHLSAAPSVDGAPASSMTFGAGNTW